MKKIFLLFLFFIPVISFSCECPQLQPISKDLCKQYDVIFYGRVDSVVVKNMDGIGTAYFTILGLHKGSVEQHVSVDYDCSSECLMSFEKCDEWIIYGVFQHFDLVTVNICSHSRKKAAGGTSDFYQTQSGRSFDAEIEFLKTTLGLQPFASHNNINDQEKEMRPHNDQPSALNKMWLLLVSFGVMVIVYIVSKKYRKK